MFLGLVCPNGPFKASDFVGFCGFVGFGDPNVPYDLEFTATIAS